MNYKNFFKQQLINEMAMTPALYAGRKRRQDAMRNNIVTGDLRGAPRAAAENELGYYEGETDRMLRAPEMYGIAPGPDAEAGADNPMMIPGSSRLDPSAAWALRNAKHNFHFGDDEMANADAFHSEYGDFVGRAGHPNFADDYDDTFSTDKGVLRQLFRKRGM